MILRVLVMLLILVSTTACDIPFMPKAAENTEISGSEEEEPPPPAAEEIKTHPDPLVSNYLPLTITTPDGAALAGTLYAPCLPPYVEVKKTAGSEEEELLPAEENTAGEEGEKKEGAVEADVPPAKVQTPLIILFHMLSGNQWDWKTLPKTLYEKGYAVLTLDLRGHGDSTYKKKTINVWREFDEAEWAKLAQDPQVWLKMIRKNPALNCVNTHQLGLIGASMGANIAIQYAGSNPKEVMATAMLSPGIDYRGVKTLEPIKKAQGAFFFIASQEDAYAVSSSETLYKTASGHRKMKVFKDAGHGTDILVSTPALEQDLADWLLSVLPNGKHPTLEKNAVPEVSSKPEVSPKPETAVTDQAKAPAVLDPTHPKVLQAKVVIPSKGQARQKVSQVKRVVSKKTSPRRVHHAGVARITHPVKKPVHANKTVPLPLPTP
jgi:pimeloyl-ACP methyl ester carboxylesterase